MNMFKTENWKEITAIIASLGAIGIVTIDPEVLDILPGQIEAAVLAVVAVFDSVMRIFGKKGAEK